MDEKIITQSSSIPFYKRKAVVIPMVAIMSLAMIAAAVGYFLLYTADVNIRVSEGMSVVPFSIDEDAFAGSVILKDISLTNDADVPYTITIEFNNTLPQNWTSSLPMEFVMNGGESINITMNVTIPSNVNATEGFQSAVLIGRS